MVSRNQCHSIKCAGGKDSLQQCKIKAAGFLGFTAVNVQFPFVLDLMVLIFFKCTKVKSVLSVCAGE